MCHHKKLIDNRSLDYDATPQMSWPSQAHIFEQIPPGIFKQLYAQSMTQPVAQKQSRADTDADELDLLDWSHRTQLHRRRRWRARVLQVRESRTLHAIVPKAEVAMEASVCFGGLQTIVEKSLWSLVVH